MHLDLLIGAAGHYGISEIMDHRQNNTAKALKKVQSSLASHYFSSLPGYPKHDVAGHGSGNSRNGKSRKTVKGDAGEITIEVPRDRDGTFEPQLIEKHQTRFEGFDSKIFIQRRVMR